MRQEFIIPGRLDGLNEIISSNRSNHYAGAKEKKSQQEIVSWAIKASRLKPMHGPVYIRFKWIEPNAKRDPDNIVSAKKFILDALVQTGVLGNDSWKWISGFHDTWSIDRNNPRIIVELEDSDE